VSGSGCEKLFVCTHARARDTQNIMHTSARARAHLALNAVKTCNALLLDAVLGIRERGCLEGLLRARLALV
jgi:hypothetical protein